MENIVEVRGGTQALALPMTYVTKISFFKRYNYRAIGSLVSTSSFSGLKRRSLHLNIPLRITRASL